MMNNFGSPGGDSYLPYVHDTEVLQSMLKARVKARQQSLDYHLYNIRADVCNQGITVLENITQITYIKLANNVSSL